MRHTPAPSPPDRRPQRQPGLLGPILILIASLAAAILSHPRPGLTQTEPDPPELTLVDPELSPDLFDWTDTCNVHVLRHGNAALLINLGDGSVLDHLATIGVQRVEWVLFTQHQREFGQGAPRLDRDPSGTRVGAPEAERALFEQPHSFRRIHVRLGDPHTVHGASYVRPPVEPVTIDQGFEPGDSFTWHGHEMQVVDTRGNSPGGITYLLHLGNQRVAFSGGLMLDGARMANWYDSEWDYGFGAGPRALRQSVDRLLEHEPDLMLPGHGPAIPNPADQLRDYAEKLAEVYRLHLRGYDLGADDAFHDNLTEPTEVPNLGRITPSLFKIFRPEGFHGNFGILIADDGHALVIDCGLMSEDLLAQVLQGLVDHHGLVAIDALVVTHMHGDHFLMAPYLKQHWNAQVWALDNMVDLMRHPQHFDYPAMIQSYGHRRPDGSPLDGVEVDRVFEDGETFEWRGHRFTVDWMPGQTEFALSLHGEIDGRLVAFTGDNLFGDPDNPEHTGNEALVARNSTILEESYIHAAEYLTELQPDLLVGGHSFVMDRPAELIERYRRWSYAMRDALLTLNSEQPYPYWYDPFWVRAEPYRIALTPGRAGDAVIWVRNFHDREQAHLLKFHPPAGVTVEPAVIEGKVDAGSRDSFPLRVTLAPGTDPGPHLVGIDITLDGRRYGQRFDFIVHHQEEAED